MHTKNQKELKRILTNKNIVESIYDNIDILIDIIPEVNDMINFPHNHPHHHLDIWNHTLFALSISYNDFDLRLCLLLHDIGKPHSFQDEEVRHFKGHPQQSSIISRTILTRLKYDQNYIDKICYLIEKHDEPITKEEIDKNYELAIDRFAIQYCDALAHNPEKLKKRIKYLNDTLELLKEINPTIKVKINNKMKYPII